MCYIQYLQGNHNLWSLFLSTGICSYSYLLFCCMEPVVQLTRYFAVLRSTCKSSLAMLGLFFNLYIRIPEYLLLESDSCLVGLGVISDGVESALVYK